MQKLVQAVNSGLQITSVRFRHLPDEMHKVIKTRAGKVALQLGKTVIQAELWLSKQTKRFRNYGPNTKGKLGPNSTVNINSVEVYLNGTGWIGLAQMTAEGIRRCSPKKKKPSAVAKIERQLTLGRGPDTIADTNTSKSLLEVCKKWGVPADEFAHKIDMATALIVEQWKKLTGSTPCCAS